MTITLDVRDLWVLFAGPPRPSVIDGSRTALLVEPSMEASLPAGHRIGLPGVTFTVQGGECLAVLGTSGAGEQDKGTQEPAHQITSSLLDFSFCLR